MNTLRSLFTAALLVGCVLITGCGTSAQVEARTPEHMAGGERIQLQLNASAMGDAEAVSILRERLRADLSSNGWLARGNGAANRTLEVRVTHYRMRPESTRILTGIFSGKDSIVSSVILKDAAGRVLMHSTVESHNSLAVGTSQGLLEDHADKIVGMLRGDD